MAGLITVIRQMQVLLIAGLLLGACLSKVVRAARAGSMRATADATALFPDRLRVPAGIGLCAIELTLGLALIATARTSGDATDVVRVLTALFFLVAMSALLEARERRPDLGCGCFGDLSTRPIGPRSILRAGILAGAAAASLGAPPLRLPPPGPRALTDLGILAAEVAVVAILSPEVGELLVRLGYAEPCERRSVPTQRVLASLHRSRAWRKNAALTAGDRPKDMWRELCWWFLVYPSRGADDHADIVFAVRVARRHPPILVTVVSRAPPAGDPDAGAGPAPTVTASEYF